MAGIIGSLVTTTTGWYTELNKPFFTPPGWIFGPVWITLYVMMGLALYLVWNSKVKDKKAIYFFSGQLILNALWSLLFFGLQSPLLALIDILILMIAILLTIIYFYKIDKRTVYLLTPYFVWVTFAMILNIAIYLLN